VLILYLPLTEPELLAIFLHLVSNGTDNMRVSPANRLKEIISGYLLVATVPAFSLLLFGFPD
jgi:hypothetical protein